MHKALPLVALCAMLAGCSFLPTGNPENAHHAPVQGPLYSGDAAAPDKEGADWWRASTIFVAETRGDIGRGRNRPGTTPGGYQFISDAPPALPDVFPPDLNEGKSFWAPDREFNHLFENFKYPDRPWWRDFADTPSALWKDAKHLVKPPCLLTLGMGAALAGGTRTMDHDIADHFEDVDVLGGAEDFGNTLGHPGLHLGIAGAVYLYGRLGKNDAALERSLILAEGLVINDLATLMLKAAFNRERPNGDNLSFPSAHVSSTFALAAMLDEMYGHRVGYPMYLLGGFVAFSRMNDEKHYLSDAVFASFLGYAVGKAVFDRHRMKMFGFELRPYVEEGAGAPGLAFTLDF